MICVAYANATRTKNLDKICELTVYHNYYYGLNVLFQHVTSEQLVQIKLPDKARVPSDWVWTLKIDKVKNVAEDYRTAQMRDFEDGITILKTDKNNVVN